MLEVFLVLNRFFVYQGFVYNDIGNHDKISGSL